MAPTRWVSTSWTSTRTGCAIRATGNFKGITCTRNELQHLDAGDQRFSSDHHVNQRRERVVRQRFRRLHGQWQWIDDHARAFWRCHHQRAGSERQRDGCWHQDRGIVRFGNWHRSVRRPIPSSWAAMPERRVPRSDSHWGLSPRFRRVAQPSAGNITIQVTSPNGTNTVVTIPVTVN